MMGIKRVSAALIALFFLIMPAGGRTALAYPGIEQNRTFLFSDAMWRPITIPDVYRLYKVFSVVDGEGEVVAEPQDLFVADDGRIYILDMSGGRIVIYRKDFSWEKVIDTFTLEDGRATALNKPEGLFVLSDGTIYIADTANQRILSIDEGGHVLKVTDRPESFRGTSMESFYPTKLVVDSAGRITVVARNINMGLLQFDADGHFTGYTGAPPVKTNILTKLWKRFSTQAQKAQMQQFVPTEYSNISIDKNDFIYGTISSIAYSDALDELRAVDNPGDFTPIKRLNGVGEDVLKRNGLYSPMGNMDIYSNSSVSRMIDVALGPAGSYTLLDNSKNILYTYSDEGILLHAFGGSGKRKDQFERPVAIAYQGDNLLVLDALLSQFMVYKPTVYGRAVLDAITAEYEGDYDVAYQRWSDVARRNSNFGYAYVGLGKIRQDEGSYKEAMAYYKYAFEGDGYSKAKEKYRQEILTRVFPILFLLIGAAAAVLLIRGAVKKARGYLRGRL